MIFYENSDREDDLYVQSRRNPTERFIIQETTSMVVYYIDGVKCASMKKFDIIKEKSKPYVGSSWHPTVKQKQLSFDFIDEWMLYYLRVKPLYQDLSFVDKQLSLEL